MSSYSFKGRKCVWKPRNGEQKPFVFPTQQNNKGTDAGVPEQCQPSDMDHGSNKYELQKWSLEKLMRLLRLYALHRCLWDLNSPQYGNRKLRKAALTDIVAAMQAAERDGNAVMTEYQVMRKINILRATYRYEKRRIKQRMLKGLGTRTKLKWFPLADAFLRKAGSPKQLKRLRKLDEIRQDDSDLEDAVVFTIDSEALIPMGEEGDGEAVGKEEMILPTNELQESQVPLGEESVSTPEGCRAHEFPGTYKPWTSQESLTFIRLLKNYTKLWSLESDHTGQLEASKEIAQAMDISLDRVQTRVNNFRKIYKQEMAKIEKNCQYKPPFEWWPEVEKTFHPKALESHKELAMDDCFVDVNGKPPPTPAGMKRSVHCKEDLQEESVETNFTSDPKAGSDCPTKLILNGLEEDLLEGKWSLKHSVKFLRLYGAHRCLWDLSDVNYRNYALRQAAMEDMASAMGHGLTTDHVAKKIRIFRITYMQHRKRLLEAIKHNREPEIQLRWFPLADSFLRPHTGLHSIKEQEREVPQFNFHYVYANLNLIDPALLSDLRGKGTQNIIQIGSEGERKDENDEENAGTIRKGIVKQE